MHRATWWNEDLTLFRDSVQRFIASELEPLRSEWRRTKQIGPEVWRALGDMGMLLPACPEEYGGSGGSFAHEAVVIDALERQANELAAAVTVHGTIVSNYIVKFGTEEQKNRWLPRLASGETVGAIAMTEPGTGSDLRAIRTRAAAIQGGYLLNGQKTFITNGDMAGLIIVVARTGDEASPRISLIVVDRSESTGVTSRQLEKIGLQAADTAEVFFDNVEVPRENLLGTEEGLGLGQLMEQLPQERLGIAVAAAAAMEKACDLAVSYARERVAFGSPIIDYQANAFTLAQRSTEAYLARVFVDHCITRVLDGTFDGTLAAMVKLWTTEQLFDVVDDCLQIHGGYGYMSEYEIGRMLADSRVLKIYGGTNEMMKLIIARNL